MSGVRRDGRSALTTLAVIVSLLVFVSTPVHALKRGAGTAVGNSILRGHVGGAPAALGGAYTAVARGPLALRYNPAGLWDEERNRLFLQYNAHILDITRSDVAFTRPLRDGAIGVSLSLIDYGAIVRTTTVNKTGGSTFNPQDYLVRLGYGAPVSDRLRLGASIGLYMFELDDGVSSSGVTADLALHYTPPIDGVEIAASLRNLGSRARFYLDQEELPLAGVLGISYRPVSRLLVSVDGEVIRNEGAVIRAGAEYEIVDWLLLRAGYNGDNEASNGLTVGAGFRTEDLQIDYAYVPFGDIGQSHQVSAEVAFGRPAGRRRGEDAAPVPYRGVEREAPGREPERVPVAAAPAPSPPAPSAPEVVEDPERLRTEAAAAYESGDAATAILLYERLLVIEPADALSRYNLATVCYSIQRYEQAAYHYRHLVSISPEDEEAWLYLGYAEYHAGRRDDAWYAWQRVLSLNPENEYARAACQLLE